MKNQHAHSKFWLGTFVTLGVAILLIACSDTSPVGSSEVTQNSIQSAHTLAAVNGSVSMGTVTPPPPSPSPSPAPEGGGQSPPTVGEVRGVNSVASSVEGTCPDCSFGSGKGSINVSSSTKLKSTIFGSEPMSFELLNDYLRPGLPVKVRARFLGNDSWDALSIIVKGDIRTAGTIDVDSATVRRTGRFVLNIRGQAAKFKIDPGVTITRFSAGARVSVRGVVPADPGEPLIAVRIEER